MLLSVYSMQLSVVFGQKRVNVMTLDEANEGQTVSYTEARHEVLKHGHSIFDFINELGHHETYNSTSVMAWLGY